MNILLILKQACDAREVFILSAGDIDISFFSGYKRRVSWSTSYDFSWQNDKPKFESAKRSSMKSQSRIRTKL